MFPETFADFPREVEAGEAGILLLQFLDDAEALVVVVEAAVRAHQAVERLLPLVAEGRVPEVVRQSDGLGEVLVQAERAGDVPRDRGDLHGVGEPGAEMVAAAVEEDLGLVLQAAEGAAVDHAVPVALELRAPGRRILGVDASARCPARLGERR